MSTRRPTIREVAARAGVSTGTVSNVLTGRRPVQRATRERIEHAITDLGYVPDLAARALIARRGRAMQTHGAATPRLLAVGYLCADYVTQVAVLPHRADRVTAAAIERTLGGRAANVAVTAAGLGEPWPIAVDLLSVVGEDEESDWAEAMLADRRVQLLPQSRQAGGRLSRCIIMVEANGSRTIVNEPLQVPPAALARWLAGRAAIEAAQALFVQGDQAAVLAPVLAVAADGLFTVTQIGTGEARALGIRWLDELAHLFDLVVLNQEAARELLGTGGGTDDLIQRVAAGFAPLPCRLALTLGAEGALLIERGQTIARAAAPVVEVVDETGAGDTFTGCLIAAFLHGLPPAEALAAAVRGGSMAVTVTGAQEHALKAVAISAGELPDAAAEKPI